MKLNHDAQRGLELLSEAKHVLAVLEEVAAPLDIHGIAPALSPEIGASLWWRDMVLRIALPLREFDIVHAEAKALAATPRIIRALVDAVEQMQAGPKLCVVTGDFCGVGPMICSLPEGHEGYHQSLNGSRWLGGQP